MNNLNLKRKVARMKRKRLLFLLALIASGLLLSISCEKEKIVTDEIYLLYWDLFGNAEFEEDGDYPPPDQWDNISDELITVTLRFGESIAEFKENDVYGYFITIDKNPVNYAFKFVPSGRYYLEAELVVMDSCFYDNTEKFVHTDSTDSVVELRPAFIGVNRLCFDLILSSANEEEYVQVGERSWVTKKVYQCFYKNEQGFGEITRP